MNGMEDLVIDDHVPEREHEKWEPMSGDPVLANGYTGYVAFPAVAASATEIWDDKWPNTRIRSDMKPFDPAKIGKLWRDV